MKRRDFSSIVAAAVTVPAIAPVWTAGVDVQRDGLLILLRKYSTIGKTELMADSIQVSVARLPAKVRQ